MDQQEAGSLKMNTALEYSTRVVQEGGRRCKKSTLNDLVHLTPLRIPLMNPPKACGVFSLCAPVEKQRITPRMHFMVKFMVPQDVLIRPGDSAGAVSKQVLDRDHRVHILL
jgi:hypothetical protein